jgi:hypothetical protein
MLANLGQVLILADGKQRQSPAAARTSDQKEALKQDVRVEPRLQKESAKEQATYYSRPPSVNAIAPRK